MAFSNSSVRKVILPDTDCDLLKACKEGEIDLADLSGNLSRKWGLKFQVFPPPRTQSARENQEEDQDDPAKSYKERH